jgi:molecular chaperone DnaK
MSKDNNTLGVFRLEGIPPAPRGIPQVEVTFDIDANGILNVTAKDRATGKSQAIAITASTNLNESDIQRMVREAEQNASEDQRRRELIEARNTADQVIYQTEKSLSGLNGQAPAEIRQQLESQIAELREAMNGEDTEHIRRLTNTVQQTAMAMGQAAYQNGDSAEGTTGSDEDVDEDVIEGEYEAA